MTRSTAYSKFFWSTLFAFKRAACSAASLQIFAISAPKYKEAKYNDKHYRISPLPCKECLLVVVPLSSSFYCQRTHLLHNDSNFRHLSSLRLVRSGQSLLAPKKGRKGKFSKIPSLIKSCRNSPPRSSLAKSHAWALNLPNQTILIQYPVY